MAANEISNVVLLFPNIEWPASDTDSDLFRSVAQLRPNISYAEDITDNIQTLSSHNSPSSGLIQGFLYVPDLLASDPCVNISKQYIPTNVTRQANLPPTDFTLIALAPWISAECTRSYLSAARLDPMRAFIFYLPDNSTDAPPLPHDEVWGLHDGGRWKSTNPYPVYAIPGATGARMMDELSLYSGNLTDVPFGNQIAELPDIDVRDYVRIFSQIFVPSSSSLPGVWLFVLVIAAVLAIMLAFTSATMHLVQMQRRKSLHRRVLSGEVDLEALGIKRLTVPDEIIRRMPLFTYHCTDDQPEKHQNTTLSPDATSAVEQHGPDEVLPIIDEVNRTNHERQEKESTADDLVLPLKEDSKVEEQSTFAHKFLPYSQPTCPICLDDFESGVTTIRELPCGHIYHPECIDTFLSDNSSLCPMCKKTVLPAGYCGVKITNNMVRRERNTRRLRARVTVNDNNADIESGSGMNRIQDWGSSFGRMIRRSPTYARGGAEIPSPISLQAHEPTMTTAMSAEPRDSVLGNRVPQPLSPGLSRQEIAQRRIQELATTSAPLDDPDVVNERRRPKWRRRLATVFPGFS